MKLFYILMAWAGCLRASAQSWTNLSELAREPFMAPLTNAQPHPMALVSIKPPFPLPMLRVSKTSPEAAATNLAFIVQSPQNLINITWQITDTNTVAVNVYAGADVDDAGMIFNVPCRNVATFLCAIPFPLQVWVTGVDDLGNESDPSNVLVFIPPPPPTNIVLSWMPPRSNVWIEGSDDLMNWLGITNVTGSNVVLSITNSPYQFYDALTTDGLPAILLNSTLQ
jgi:hypothetical protein